MHKNKFCTLKNLLYIRGMQKYILLYTNCPIKLLFTKEADFTVATYKAIISRDYDRKQKIITLDISYNGNQLWATKTLSQNTLLAGNYFFDLRIDIDNQNAYPLVQLPVIVKPVAI